jgi:hypothetical protein
VLTHLDRLPHEALPVLVDVLEPHRESTDPDGQWVVATTGKQRGGVRSSVTPSAGTTTRHAPSPTGGPTPNRSWVLRTSDRADQCLDPRTGGEDPADGAGLVDA